MLEEKKKIIVLTISILSLLLLVLTISTVVDIFNKVKENKYIGQDAEFKNTIVISDVGEVSAVPDLAMVSLTVTNEAERVEEAIAENADKMNTVIEEIKKLGIEEKDLKTTSFNIYPRYEYIKDRFGYTTGKRTLAGYEITQVLEVKIRDIEKVGTVIEKGTSVGINDVSNLRFTIDDQEELKKQARALAIEKAKQKAQNLTAQLGVKLGRITSFSENYYVPYLGARSFETEGGMGGGVPDIEAGENKISVSIIITYEIY